MTDTPATGATDAPQTITVYEFQRRANIGDVATVLRMIYAGRLRAFKGYATGDAKQGGKMRWCIPVKAAEQWIRERDAVRELRVTGRRPRTSRPAADATGEPTT